MHTLLICALKPVAIAIVRLVCLLISIAFYTLAERKIMAAVQRRSGPNVVVPLGLLQPIADAVKLAAKELIMPTHANGRIFIIVSMTVLLFALLGWTVIPFNLYDHSTAVDVTTLLDVTNEEQTL